MPPPKIVHGHAAAPLFVQAVGQRRRSGLVHQPQNFETSEPARILGRLPLRVIEIRGYGNHGAVHASREKIARPRSSIRAE